MEMEKQVVLNELWIMNAFQKCHLDVRLLITIRILFP